MKKLFAVALVIAITMFIINLAWAYLLLQIASFLLQINLATKGITVVVALLITVIQVFMSKFFSI